jgi:hypothetical protein
MFDRERQVQVTPRPRRWRRDDRLRELGVGKGMVSLEHQAHHLQVPALAIDVLRAGGAAPKKRCEKRECGESPEPYSASALHPFNTRAPGGWPGGSSRA